MFKLTQKILNLNDANSYLACVVTGDLRIGKSAYCLKTAHQYYKYKGCDDKEAWKRALECVIFDIEDIIDHFKTHSFHNRADITILDDASVHLGSGRWFTNMNDVMELESLFTVGGTSTRALLINCPNTTSLMKYLRHMEGFRGRVTKRQGNPWDRSITMRRSNMYASNTGMKLYWSKSWVDNFSAYLPNWIFEEYMSKRDKYKDVIINKMEKKKNV